MTRLKFGRVPALFYQKFKFNIVDSRSIAVRNSLVHMLLLLSVNEILLLGYVKWSTNFRGLSFNMEIGLTCLKHMNSVLSEFTEATVSCSVFEAIQQTFRLCTYLFKKRLMIYIF